MTTINELINETEKDPEKKKLLDEARVKLKNNKEDILKNLTITDITEEMCINIYLSLHVSQLSTVSESVQNSWRLGQQLYQERIDC